MSKKALVLIAEAFEEIEAITVIDVLRRAGVNVTVAGVYPSDAIDKPLPIKASRGVVVTPDVVLSSLLDSKFSLKVLYDVVVVPGGMPGAQHLSDNSSVVSLCSRQLEENRLLAAICAAPAVVLGSHGLLKGYTATCHPSMESRLGQDRISSRVVISRNLITSMGPGTAMEFALVIVECLLGRTKAEDVNRPMFCIYEPPQYRA